MNKNVLEEKINNQVNMIVERDILTCETMLFAEVNRIAYGVETDLSQLLYENFENLFVDNRSKIEELENKIKELELSIMNINYDDTEYNNTITEYWNLKIEELNNQIEELESEQEDPQEILEVWKISSWLYEKLKKQGEPVIESDFGCYWGRTCSGQSIKLDYCINQIAKEIVEKYGI